MYYSMLYAIFRTFRIELSEAHGADALLVSLFSRKTTIDCFILVTSCHIVKIQYLRKKAARAQIPFEVFHTSLRSTYGQKMDSKLFNHLGRFPREST